MLSLELGESRLPNLLKQKKISQAQFAKQMRVSPQFINQIIKGERTFSLKQAFHAAFLLGCSMDDLYDNPYKHLGDRREE